MTISYLVSVSKLVALQVYVVLPIMTHFCCRKGQNASVYAHQAIYRTLICVAQFE